jgi:hypothetical protein
MHLPDLQNRVLWGHRLTGRVWHAPAEQGAPPHGR